MDAALDLECSKHKDPKEYLMHKVPSRTHTGAFLEGGADEHPPRGTEEVTRNLRVCQIYLDKTRQALGTPHLCPADNVSCAWGGVSRPGCQLRDACNLTAAWTPPICFLQGHFPVACQAGQARLSASQESKTMCSQPSM